MQAFSHWSFTSFYFDCIYLSGEEKLENMITIEVAGVPSQTDLSSIGFLLCIAIFDNKMLGWFSFGFCCSLYSVVWLNFIVGSQKISLFFESSMKWVHWDGFDCSASMLSNTWVTETKKKG